MQATARMASVVSSMLPARRRLIRVVRLTPEFTYDDNHLSTYSNSGWDAAYSRADCLPWLCGTVRLGMDRQRDLGSLVQGASDSVRTSSRLLLVHGPLLLAADSCDSRSNCCGHIRFATKDDPRLIRDVRLKSTISRPCTTSGAMRCPRRTLIK